MTIEQQITCHYVVTLYIGIIKEIYYGKYQSQKVKIFEENKKNSEKIICVNQLRFN
jgi:hypothetical protein